MEEMKRKELQDVKNKSSIRDNPIEKRRHNVNKIENSFNLFNFMESNLSKIVKESSKKRR